MGIDWLVSSGLWRKGRRSDLSTRLAQRVLRTHAPTSRVTRAQIQARDVHTHTTIKNTGQVVLGNGSYCYGYYLPLIRTLGSVRCSSVCVARNAWIRNGVCVREGKRDEAGEAPRWTHHHREWDTPPAWLQTPPSSSSSATPRPDPRDFQDTRHTTHKLRTLCGVNQLDPSPLRAWYRYNGVMGAAARQNFLTTNVDDI